MSATWVDLQTAMKDLGAKADYAESLRAVGPYVLDRGCWRRRTADEWRGRFFSRRYIERLSFREDPVFALLKKRPPTDKRTHQHEDSR